MFTGIIKLFHFLLLLVALTGFVCAHKIQAEEECLSSNVICYECDSRYDPNCADPFDFSPSATLEAPKQQQHQLTDESSSIRPDHSGSSHQQHQNQHHQLAPNETNKATNIPSQRPAKKLPTTAVCHGCCVKITRKMDDGVHVKRTCTTSLQINFFMISIVCMKESGDRGKMCFCETDYCNGQPGSRQSNYQLLVPILVLVSILLIHSNFR